jgi:hypothetical protein
VSARRLAWSAIGLVASGGLVACFDLFHSTTFTNGCDESATAACEDASVAPAPEAGPVDAGTDGPLDFCAWDHATARKAALRACAWLGACAGAAGDDAFGACVVRATLAYDCAANPNRPVRGAARDAWRCLAKAASCGDVGACVEPSGTRGLCAATDAGYVQCDGTSNKGTLITCAPGGATGATPASLESCAAEGQTCAPLGATAACAGASVACASAGVSCDSAGALHDCDPDAGPADLGVDCTSYGAGACVGSGACLALGDAGCAATSAVTCSANGTATGCPSGVVEAVDCASVLGVASGACDPGASGRPWDVARACATSAACGADTCSGSILASCARGATVSLDCASEGLGGCTLATYPGDTTPHARCGQPDGG